MVSLGELINNQKPTTHFIDSWSNSLGVLLSVWVQCVSLKRLIIYSKLYFSCILQWSWMVLYTLLIWPCFHRPVVVTLTVFHCTDTLHRRRKGNLWNKIGTATLLSSTYVLLTHVHCLSCTRYDFLSACHTGYWTEGTSELSWLILKANCCGYSNYFNRMTLDTPGNRKGMPNADFTQWTPLEYVAK